VKTLKVPASLKAEGLPQDEYFDEVGKASLDSYY